MMQRYDLEADEEENYGMYPAKDGHWIPYQDVEPVLQAAKNLIAARGRFHVEQRYVELQAALKNMEGQCH
jgi:hypothetical protein